MDVPTIAVAILGGAFDAWELGDNDIEPVPGILDKLQGEMVTGFDDVHIDLIDRTHFDRVTAERDALQLRLNAVEEENDRLRELLGKAHPLTNDIAHDPHVWLEIDQALEKRP